MIEEATPGGTNVEFAQSVDDGVIAVRTWERGVGETRACGTGAVAVASVALTEHHGATSATIRLARRRPSGGPRRRSCLDHGTSRLFLFRNVVSAHRSDRRTETTFPRISTPSR